MYLKRNIRKRRQDKNMGKTVLAKLLGVQKNTVSHREEGTRDPNISNLLKLCFVLECTLEDMFEYLPKIPSYDMIKYPQTKLSKLRVKAGFTQKELAKKIGVSQHTVFDRENSRRKIKDKYIKDVMLWLDCDKEDLFPYT